jgi:hypothetical protein
LSGGHVVKREAASADSANVAEDGEPPVDVTARKAIAYVIILAAGVTMSACSHRVLTEDDAVTGIDSGSALNARPGAYRVSDVRVTLVKVVSLPDERLGLRFSFKSNSPGCCSVFPRIALAPGRSGNHPFPTTSIVIPTSSIAADGSLRMRLSESGGATVPFTIDLRALGVSVG